MVFPKLEETAVLIVEGMRFSDWETVTVRHALRDHPAYHCRFTCSEGLPLSKNFALMRIKPGDICTVILAGELAFTGKVETRQVYYDANRHHIEIQCATWMVVATASVITKTGEWINKTFGRIARDVLGKMGINVVFEGGPEPTYEFPRISSTPGESVHDFLDNLARGLPASGIGISFTSNVQGDFVVIMGPGSDSDAVVESQNILIGREIIYNASMAGSNPVLSQGTGDDQDNGAKVAHSPFDQEAMQTFGASFSPAVIVNEMASFDTKLLKGRAGSEGKWLSEDQITVIVTVYGWLRPSGGLWRRDQRVSVTSPMLIMKNESLILKSVTFTQDGATGTRSTLELCNELAVGGLIPQLKG